MNKKKKIKTHLVCVEELQELIKLVVISGFLNNHKPLSVIVVGKVGNGKTEITASFEAQNITFLTDLSSSGVYKIMKNEHISHIIISDFTKVTMKAKQTTRNLLTTLNSAMEEGLYKQELKDVSTDFKGRNIGIITSTTKASFSQNKKFMEDFGLTSRFLIVSYDYNENTIDKIMDSIYKCEYLLKQYKGIPIKDNIGKSLRKKEVFIPEDLARKLNNKKENPFRTQKQLQTLACCSALADNRNMVNEKDIQNVTRLNRFINLNYTKI